MLDVGDISPWSDGHQPSSTGDQQPLTQCRIYIDPYTFTYIYNYINIYIYNYINIYIIILIYIYIYIIHDMRIQLFLLSLHYDTISMIHDISWTITTSTRFPGVFPRYATQVTRGRRAAPHQWHLGGGAGASKHGLGTGEATLNAADPPAQLPKCRMDAAVWRFMASLNWPTWLWHSQTVCHGFLPWP